MKNQRLRVSLIKHLPRMYDVLGSATNATKKAKQIRKKGKVGEGRRKGGRGETRKGKMEGRRKERKANRIHWLKHGVGFAVSGPLLTRTCFSSSESRASKTAPMSQVTVFPFPHLCVLEILSH